MMKLTLFLVFALLLGACSGSSSQASPFASGTPSTTTPSASPVPPTPEPPTAEPPSPSPSTPPAPGDGVEALVHDLEAAGAEVGPPSAFDAMPLARNGASICVDGQTVQVYIYPSPAERMAATGAIDPDDPTNVGTAIMEWDGEPKFWERDRVVVLYLGRDEATTELLTTVLGEPFARGEARPQLLPGTC